ncbi:MAG TPA: glycosyl hydrolase [Coriobacteriia bacterium]|jgi:beta-mannanase
MSVRRGIALAVVAAMLVAAGCRAAVPSRVSARAGGPGSTARIAPRIPASAKVAPPAAGAYLGLYRPPAPFDITAIDTYESVSSKRPAIVMWYQPWAAKGPYQFDAGTCISVLQRGAVPMITWEPWDPGTNANYVHDPANQRAYALRNIVDGKFDSYIRSWATAVKSVGGPVMIRPMHEMNGDWYPWGGLVNGNTPELYVAAWRRIHDIFAREGVTNVTWVWSINHMSVPDNARNSYAAYYPGDAYVDWTAISGFNWGTSSPYSSWRTFESWYTKPLAYLKTLGKPVVIAEFACVENGGDKAAWLQDAYTRIRRDHPEVKAVIYYDALEKGPESTQDWRISTSAKSLASYRSAVGSSYYLEGPTSTLSRWFTVLSLGDWQYLRGIKPVY